MKRFFNNNVQDLLRYPRKTGSASEEEVSSDNNHKQDLLYLSKLNISLNYLSQRPMKQTHSHPGCKAALTLAASKQAHPQQLKTPKTTESNSFFIARS